MKPKFSTPELEHGYIDIIASPSSPHQKQHAEAYGAALDKLGIPYKLIQTQSQSRAANVMCWGWRNGEPLRQRGSDVMVIERGYIGDRLGKWSSLMMNGLNGRAGFPVTPNDNGARFDQHHSDLYKPWNPDGDYILLIGQVDGDAALQGKDMQRWYESKAKEIHATGQRVIFRQHPGEKARGLMRSVKHAEISNRSLDEDIENSRLVVTWNSNTAVDAMLAGKPVVCEDKGSMAWAVSCGNTVQQWQTNEPDNRKHWANALAWCQWTIEEIANGDSIKPFLLNNSEGGSIAHG